MQPGIHRPKPADPPQAERHITRTLDKVQRVQETLYLPRMNKEPNLFPSVANRTNPPVLLSAQYSDPQQPDKDVCLCRDRIKTGHDITHIAQLPLLQLVPCIRQMEVDQPIPKSSRCLLFHFYSIQNVLPYTHRYPYTPENRPDTPPAS